MDYRDNITYIFLPFTFGEPENFSKLKKTFEKDTVWQKSGIKQNYLYKYISDKLNDSENSLCHLYTLKNPDFHPVINSNHTFCEDDDVSFEFKIDDADIFCFASGVGIFSFRLTFPTNDPFKISTYQYYLKKVARGSIDGNGTLLDIAKRFLPESRSLELNFFYYTNAKTERANILTYIHVPPQDDFDKEFFFLNHCYNSETYQYFKNSSMHDKIIRLDENRYWGVSSEAAVCLACPTEKTENFIKNTFFENFTTQYRFMFIFLLHQKYALYNFLTKINKSNCDDIKVLKNYKKQLFAFENDFVFSTVTEVPQYQHLYEEIAEAFALKSLFEDVNEPLEALDSMKSQHRDSIMNAVLFIVSLFALVSVAADSLTLIDLLKGLLGSLSVSIIKCSCLGIIILTIGFLIGFIIRRKK